MARTTPASSSGHDMPAGTQSASQSSRQTGSQAGPGRLRHALFVRAGLGMRIFLFNVSVVILAGIALTGFGTAHWFLYIIPALFILSALLGICPGLNLWNHLVRRATRP